MKSDAVIQRKANDLLRKSGVEAPPVPIVAVAEALGATILFENVSDDISGGLYRRPEGPAIGVNAQHHPNRQRFTIAHEIGHLVLHESEDYFIDRTFRRDSVSSAAIDEVEIEANKFAAALLMPKNYVQASVEAYAQTLRSEDVEQLARHYKVSQQAMTLRLINLGVQLDQS